MIKDTFDVGIANVRTYVTLSPKDTHGNSCKGNLAQNPWRIQLLRINRCFTGALNLNILWHIFFRANRQDTANHMTEEQSRTSRQLGKDRGGRREREKLSSQNTKNTARAAQPSALVSGGGLTHRTMLSRQCFWDHREEERLVRRNPLYLCHMCKLRSINVSF